MGEFNLVLTLKFEFNYWWCVCEPIPWEYAEGRGNTPEDAIIEFVKIMKEKAPSIREDDDLYYGLLSCTEEGFKKNNKDFFTDE